MNKQDIQTVLDALKTSAHYLIGYSEHREAAITICEAALAEPSEPEPYDPIGAWNKGFEEGKRLSKPEPDKDLIQALTERDEYHEMADKLAEGIALHFDGDIGEHSSSNSPWDRALDLLDSAACAETMRLTRPASKPSEPKPYCCYCESDNEGIRSTYFDQTCEGCVKRMTHPAKPEKLTEREIWQTYAAGFSAEKAEPFEQIKNDPEWAEIVYMTRCIEAAVWAKFAAVKQDEAIKEKFE